jgi:SAM-dependent methyltransferase
MRRIIGRRNPLRPAAGGLLAAALVLAPAGCSEARAPAASTPLQEAASAALRAPDVRYEPSPHRVVRAMLELGQVSARDVVYDLGSGDGRLPIAAARDFGARGVGIDIDPKLVALARENARKAGVADRVSFRNEDLFTADFREATVVTLFLYPDVNMKLRPKLLETLKPGTRVVSHYHDMGDWRPKAQIRVQDRNVYLWVIPER